MISKSNDPHVNVVVRIFNEEMWIRSCLANLVRQNYLNFTVTVVDSGSVDKSLSIVNEFNQKLKLNIVRLEGEYRPGKALNLGVEAEDSSIYSIFLSAHCLPVSNNWIGLLVDQISSDDNVAGIYGRQIPMVSTGADDRRDLLMTFGLEKIVQRVDTFFHNANSIIRTSIWHKLKFDEQIIHLEDRKWAKEAIASGFQIIYSPDTPVFHEHGLHQHGSKQSFRAAGVGQVLEMLSETPSIGDHDATVHGRVFEHALVFINAGSKSIEQLNEIVEEMKVEHIRDYCYLLGSDMKIKAGFDFHLIRRNESIDDGVDFDSFIRFLLREVENDSGRIFDSIQIVDLSYEFQFMQIMKSCKLKLYRTWQSMCIPGWGDSGNYCRKDQQMYTKVNLDFSTHDGPSVFRLVLGQGACFRTAYLRTDCINYDGFEVIYSEDPRILVA